MQRRTPEVARCRSRTDEQDKLEASCVPTHGTSIAGQSDGASLGVRPLSDREAVLAGALRLVERGVGLTEKLVR